MANKVPVQGILQPTVASQALHTPSCLEERQLLKHGPILRKAALTLSLCLGKVSLLL